MKMNDVGSSEGWMSLDEMVRRIEEILNGEPTMGLAQSAPDEFSGNRALGDELYMGIIAQPIPDEHRRLEIVAPTQGLVKVEAIESLSE
jgi:hypothetical protein